MAPRVTINRAAGCAAAFMFTAILATSANADISVRFDEGAPKDRFTFENVGSCPIGASELVLDISGSKAGLIFDTTGAGAGVEVFQPLEIVSGAQSLAAITKVKDGDNAVTLSIAELQPGAKIAFTIDVDDTAGGREITVSGSEIEGASVTFSNNGKSVTAALSSGATALVKTGAC
ncbi:aggregation factor core [Roseibium sp.]|uniref:aggregation factor core n=1 Tax=Roseibium sp. TaxID=1936156 RepID=UPI003B512F5F